VFYHSTTGKIYATLSTGTQYPKNFCFLRINGFAIFTDILAENELIQFPVFEFKRFQKSHLLSILAFQPKILRPTARQNLVVGYRVFLTRLVTALKKAVTQISFELIANISIHFVMYKKIIILSSDYQEDSLKDGI